MSTSDSGFRTRGFEPPPSARKPAGNLAPADVTAMAEELVSYHALFADLFVRSEQRHWSLFYLRGQLSQLERKSIEPMVLASKGADRAAVRAVQQFLSEGAWSDALILERHELHVATDLGASDGAIIVDGSGFPKQGTHSVGVARQYCGHLGKLANCQHGVFAAYASANGYTFVDRRLYMPEAWFNAEHAALRARYGVPVDLGFSTEPALALEMVRAIAERAVLPFAWVLGDETYGADPKFLDGIEALAKRYFLEVPVSTRAWVGTVTIEAPGTATMGRPLKHARAIAGTAKPQELRTIAAELPPRAWRRYTICEGSKGSLVAEFAFVRVQRSVRHGHPAAAAWAVFRRSIDGNEVKIFLTNAPEHCSRGELARLSARRWPIETAFEEAKGELGMDHYEVRTWRGWHHHLTQTFLAHHFLVRMRLRYKKKSRR
jgi:SRSO17 transposase